MRQRLFATTVIWGSFAVTSIVLFDKTTGRPPRPLSELALIVIMAVLSLAAVIGTFAVWWHWAREEDYLKQKRAQQRVARLTAAPDEVDSHDVDTVVASRKSWPDS